ncbi:uncharacterized protein LOC122373109 [Amphibalanus amphitrite]|uniref:uncharacterized protein LOC122373109 n=1 Tax=Amphibalanus amphitrite TaxID=1232801 RepID=UPI001C924930|nr:uncharacterized protein LOC122373109 [Amphibalanus amphitrite]
MLSCPVQGDFALPAALRQQSATDILDMYSTAEMRFTPAVTPPSIVKKRSRKARGRRRRLAVAPGPGDGGRQGLRGARRLCLVSAGQIVPELPVPGCQGDQSGRRADGVTNCEYRYCGNRNCLVCRVDMFSITRALFTV